MSNRTSAPSFEERYAVLLDVARAITGTLRPDELYHAIYEQTRRVIETAEFHVSLYDPVADAATVVFCADRNGIRRPAARYEGADSVAIRERRPVLHHSAFPEPVLRALGSSSGPSARAAMAAPMIRDDRVLGIIGAQSDRPDAYDADDLELLAALAELAAVALENARHVAESEGRRREAERLEEIGRALASSLELRQVLERVIAATIDLADADAATVWLLKGENEVEIFMAGGDVALPIGVTLPVPPGLFLHIVQGRRSLIVADVRNHPLFPPEFRARFRAESAIAVPLVAEDRVIGALSVGHIEPRTYGDEDVRLLERLSFQTAIAVANARLHEQIRALSLTDPLTGLPNRRHLESVLAREFAAARRGRPLALVLFDLDHFKRYNDAAGHQAGDEALRSFGRILAAETRAIDLTARYGGDEFLSILSEADRDGGLLHAQRVADSVAHHPVLGKVGVSAGIACYEASMMNADELVRAADRDLYLRKAARGNRDYLYR